MTATTLVIGLDGADLDVVESIGAPRLPHLHRLMDRGAFAKLESIEPPATLPNWTTFLTGVDPAVHGVFDFTRRVGYRVAFEGGRGRKTPTVFAQLDRLGKVCACIGFPGTWPPERLSHGVFVSGWDSPVAFEADKSFVWPRHVYDEVVSKFGAFRFDDVNEFEGDQSGWLDALPGALVRRVERKEALASYLLRRRSWDVFAFYFGESDTASHYLWSTHDDDSPRRPQSVSAAARRGLLSVYEALDRAVGRLVEDAGGDSVDVTVVSDHGSGGSSDKVVYLNRVLAEAGFLRFKGARPWARANSRLKDHTLKRLPPRLKESLFRGFGGRLPNLVESSARFGGIDMTQTVAFSDELNYFPSIHLNQEGREPLGTVRSRDRDRVIRTIEAALSRLRDPWSGHPVVARVIRREDLFCGPEIERAPDLFLQLHLDGGYSYNVMPSANAPAGTGAFRKLSENEYLGRKGRSLPGSHRSHGIYISAGPSVRAAGRIEARIADATATLLTQIGVSLPKQAMGRPLSEILVPRGGLATRRSSWARFDDAANVAAPTLDEGRGTSLVERRLRALGYID